MFPRKFTPRLILALLAFAALSFLLQRPGYVLEQYRHWIATRAADHRHYQPDIAPRDLWMLLRVVRIELDLRFYFVVQILGGAAIAALCVFGRLRAWSTDRLLTALLALVCCWMLLLGPSPESATYVILAPILALAVVEAFSRPFPAWMRALLATACAVLLGALGFNSYIVGHKDIYSMSVQPLGALLFALYALAWVLRVAVWEPVEENVRALS